MKRPIIPEVLKNWRDISDEETLDLLAKCPWEFTDYFFRTMLRIRETELQTVLIAIEQEEDI